MNTRIGEPLIKQAANIIRGGGVIAFRTDTFYGLGADPFNRAAILRIKQLKGREEPKPILVVISDHAQIDRFIAERSRTFELLAEKFWPGALTLIGKANAELPEEITAGSGTVGIRLPDDGEVRELLRACGGALTATSANPAGQEPAKTAREARRYLGAEIDLVIDGGEARSERPSTVVDTRGSEPRLVREGVISRSQIEGCFEN